MAMKAPVIAGKYTLLRRLGHGGMAEVFLAKQMSEGGFEKLVVLKRILPHLASGPEFVTMFLDEARIAADLRHPNIVTIADVGRVNDTLFMVMEFLHGQDIRKVQRKVAAFAQMIPFAHACQMAIDAAAGLHYAHTKHDLKGRDLQIVHRDVSPQNIIVTFEGSTKIVDFGIAKAAGQNTHTSAGVLKGKYTYMSPEQAQGEVVDARTDQFALGIVLWELLTMRRLFKRDTEGLTLEAIIDGAIPRPKRFREDCPAAIEDIVMTALQKDRSRRFRDCEALAFALEDALAKEAIVHSKSRLAQYMRRLFADQLAEEASLGVVQPDGSLSVKNTFPISIRREDAKVDKKPESKLVERLPDPPVATAAEGHEATQADRKKVRSRSSEMRVDSEVQRPAPSPPAAETIRDRDTSRSTTREPQGAHRERGVDRGLERDGSRDRGPAVSVRTSPSGGRRTVLLAAAVVALAVVVVVVVGLIVTQRPGPATLVVRSEPRGASVLVDGRDSGEKTPALIRGVQSGEPHKVRLELAGHVPLDEIVTVDKAGATREISFALTPVPR